MGAKGEQLDSGGMREGKGMEKEKYLVWRGVFVPWNFS